MEFVLPPVAWRFQHFMQKHRKWTSRLPLSTGCFLIAQAGFFICCTTTVGVILRYNNSIYQTVIFSFKVSQNFILYESAEDRNLLVIFNQVKKKCIILQYFYQIALQLECLTYLPKMNLFPWTAFLLEGFENGILQKVLDRRLYDVGQHFTFWRFSRKWKFFGNFDCDFRKCFTKGFFLTENEVFRNFSFDGEFSIIQTAALKYYSENPNPK